MFGEWCCKIFFSGRGVFQSVCSAMGGCEYVCSGNGAVKFFSGRDVFQSVCSARGGCERACVRRGVAVRT